MSEHLKNKLRSMLNTNGRTEAEAEAFEAMAAKLAERHGVNLAALAVDAPQVVITDRVVGEWGKRPTEAEFAASVCGEFFDVDPITSSGLTDRMLFVGAAAHLDIAEHVFKFLCREFRWQWANRRGRCRNRRDFLFGCMVALVNKLRARNASAAPQATEAVELSGKAARAAYKKARFANLTSSPLKGVTGRSAAAARGMAAGDGIEIRPAVRGAKAAEPAQLGLFDRRLLA